jgi:serine/threonine protein kinase/tetratricopeptide (TPR) repeat protein
MCEACSAGVTIPLSATQAVTAISNPSGKAATDAIVDASLAALWRKFGPRYQITKLLGVGGMGAVYQAWDNELGEHVALKVIRPDLADLGSEPERMFKRELQLARQVTHKNVIRIHDLGEVSGTKYISMPFIEGADLATLLRERRTLSVAESIHFAKQIAEGLRAAHEVGVVHRDLKPGNILISGDLAIITDFGVAYSLSGGGPAEGGIVGTLRYMAPEQAKGLPVDHRADVYAFGLIFHEMLCGVRFNADNTTEILPGRRDDGLHDFEPRFGWPNGLNRVLSRCLAVDPLKRYGSAAMLVDDLGTLDDSGSIVARPTYLHVPSSWPFIGGRMIARGTAAATLALLIAVPVVGGAAYLTSARLTRNALVQPEPKSVLIADFDNQTGDDVFNQLIESALSVSLEGASFIDSYSRSDAQRLVGQISKGQRLDVSNARVVAQREGIDIVVAGSIRSEGSRFRIDVQAIDPVPGTVLASRSATADDRDEVLAAIGQVGADVRGALGDTTSESAIASGRETFTAASLEAASAYMRGQELIGASRYAESIPLLQKAVALDPQFGRAYASWAVSTYYTGDRAKSEELYKTAFRMAERMSERERLRTYGTYYLTVAQAYQEAIDNYTKLVELYPADSSGYANLAVAYFYTLNFTRAFDSVRRALDLYPASLKQRNNAAIFAMYSGDFTAAARGATRVLETDPGYFQAYTPLALSAIVTGSGPGAPIYEKMASTGTSGNSRAALGLADLAIYEGRYEDAVKMLPAAIALDAEANNAAGVAAKHIVVAEAEIARGAKAPAVAAAERALGASQAEAVRLAAARVYVAAGREPLAQQLATELSKQTQGYSRAYADIVRAEIALARREPVDAVEALRAAQKTADLWLVHFLRGRAYVEAGRFPEAIAEFDACVRRRGEATAIFLDDVPSVRYLATLPYWHGRAQEGLGLSAEAVASYKQFLTIREAATNDALVKEARTRIAKLAL